eukprot:1853472-Pleurochrysis_carterae.AAC.1
MPSSSGAGNSLRGATGTPLLPSSRCWATSRHAIHSASAVPPLASRSQSSALLQPPLPRSGCLGGWDT